MRFVTACIGPWCLLAGSLPAAGQCTDELPFARSQLGAAFHAEAAYFAGGSNGGPEQTAFSRVDVYVGSTGTWRRLELSVPRWSPVGVGTADHVLFAGGRDRSGPLATVDRFEVATGTRTVAQLSVPRDYPAAAAAGTKVLFGGGNGPSGTVATVDIYDTATDTWTTDSLSLARAFAGAAAVGGKVLFAGGSSFMNGATDVVDVYDIATGIWTQAALSTPRGTVVATTVGSKALFAPGPSDGSPASVDIYDDATGNWSTAPLSHIAYDALLTVGNKVLFLHRTAPTEVYDDDTGLWWTARPASSGFAWAAGTVGRTGLVARGPVLGGPPGITLESITAELPTPFCFGDPSACPCGNPGAPGAGCANSTGAGAELRSFANQCAELDTFLLQATGLVPGQTVLLFAGRDSIAGGAGSPFGDGLLCAGGTLVRGPVATAPPSGSFSFGFGLQDAFGWGPGDTRRFQVWYRDPAGPCAAGSNTTNGVELRFLP